MNSHFAHEHGLFVSGHELMNYFMSSMVMNYFMNQDYFMNDHKLKNIMSQIADENSWTFI